MNYNIHKYEMPSLNIEKDELEKIICYLLSNMNGSFDYNGFLAILANHLLANNTGFALEENTTYSGQMQQKDKSMVREILWDLIVDRYLNLGGNGHDNWPSLTITLRGVSFFRSFKG